MVSPEATPGDLELSSDLVLELIAPGNTLCPLGKNHDHDLAEYLYEPMLKSCSADRMGEFIDFSEQFINKSDHDDVRNAEKINRILALVCDMPLELPDEERLRIWDHLFSSDWIHWYGRTKDLSKILEERVKVKQPAFATSVYGTLEHVIGRKDAELSKIAEDSSPLMGLETHKAVIRCSIYSLSSILHQSQAQNNVP